MFMVNFLLINTLSALNGIWYSWFIIKRSFHIPYVTSIGVLSTCPCKVFITHIYVPMSLSSALLIESMYGLSFIKVYFSSFSQQMYCSSVYMYHLTDPSLNTEVMSHCKSKLSPYLNTSNLLLMVTTGNAKYMTKIEQNCQ